MNRRARNLVIAAVAATLATAAVAGGHRWWTGGRWLESTDDAYVGGDVTVIAPRVQGTLVEVLVQDNQPVHAGDVLARLDDRDFLAARARAVAQVDAQKALLRNLAATRALQRSLVEQARADIRSADAEWERATLERARFGTLLGSSAISRQEFERADATLKQADAGRARTRAALEASQRQIDVIGTQELQADAALSAGLAGLQTAELELSYTVLRSPIEGIVGNRSARVGALAVAGGRLLSLIPAHGLWVDANFKENQLARMRPGQAATVVTDVLPGRTLRAHVESLAPATGSQFSLLPAENATGNFTKIVQRVPVRLVIDAADAADVPLRPGLSVTAVVDTRQERPLVTARR